jgi:hypothetical protein
MSSQYPDALSVPRDIRDICGISADIPSAAPDLGAGMSCPDVTFLRDDMASGISGPPSATPSPDTRLHALYRFYDRDGALLYVGISVNAPGRFAQHRHDKPWWADVARIDIEPHRGRDEVLAAERAAIRAEAPRYNVQHAGTATAPPRVAPPPSDPPRFTWAKRVGAFGLAGGKCPVGLVTDESEGWLTVELYSWVSGYFGYEQRRIPVSSIRRFCFATRMSRAAAECRGLVVSRDDVVWDMDPLADFQTAWTKEHRG